MNDGFDIAWQNLIDRYQNKRVLVNSQLKSLYNLTSLFKESGPSIKSLQRRINDCITNLSLLGTKTKNWNIIFVYIAPLNLPNTHYVFGSSLKVLAQTYPSGVRWISSILLILTYPDCKIQNSRITSGISHSPRKYRSSDTFAANIPQRKCAICNQNHPIPLCSDYLRMSVIERLLSVKDHKCCTNCLAPFFESERCRSSNVCYICKLKHHSPSTEFLLILIKFKLILNISSTREIPRAKTSSVNPLSPDRSLEIPRLPA